MTKMKPLYFLSSQSLKTKIIIIYAIILGTTGLITTFFGSKMVSNTISNQARIKVLHDINTARSVYENKLSEIRHAVQLALFNQTLSTTLSEDSKRNLRDHLEQIRAVYNLDFLTLVDSEGKVILRTPNYSTTGDDASWLAPINAALSHKITASTEIFPHDALLREDPNLAERADIKILPTPKARPIQKEVESSGMVLLAAAPVKFEPGTKMGALYGGVLLNKNYSIVDRVWDLVYKGEKFKGQNVGTVTIFLNDLRVATNVKFENGKRAVGTRVSEEVNQAVLERGENWSDRAFVVNDWYLSEYQPIRDYAGKIIGILYVGHLEKAYLFVRNKVILTFLGIALIAFILIIATTYLVTHSFTKPLSDMVNVTKFIAKGDLSHQVKVSSKDEIGQLAISFNAMVGSLKQMHMELEEWGNTLEKKVKERTEELAAMQNTLTQSQRLASLGKMAAGIAHEINNPLGGILSLSSLALEDMQKNDPNKENVVEVVKQALRCREIVKGLLQFSRQEEGKSEYLKLNQIIDTTLALVEKQALFHNIKIAKNYDPDIPLILGDNSQLQQIFMNIIMNSVEAMEEVGTLSISTYQNKSDEQVVVEISDTGCGVPPENIDRIFDPFFTTKEVGKGTGLGLAIAYGIVTEHQGRMSVRSNVNEGTTFTIAFPVAEKVFRNNELKGQVQA
jgi:two-component system NtrC family sensor kinase